MERKKKYLAAIDLGISSKAILIQAKRIAELNKASLEALYVLDPLLLEELADGLQIPERKVREHAIKNAKIAINEILKETLTTTFSVEIRIGHPIEKILSYTEAQSTDLLFLGLTGLSNRNEGSGIIASKCLRKTHSEVMLVQSAQAGCFRKILVCIDFSHHSESIFLKGQKIAKAIRAELELLHVHTEPLSHLGLAQLFDLSSKKILFDKQDKMREFIGRFPEYSNTPSPTLQVKKDKSASLGIVNYAKSENVDLIVLGTHGIRSLKSVLLGSTAENVLRNAPCSLLFIRSH